MSGFSAEWLDLREPADQRARAASLLGQLHKTFMQKTQIAVADLGCGSGSTIRAVAAMLPARQRWRLYDYDEALLAAARQRLQLWAQAAIDEDDGLRLTWYGKSLHVSFHQADLNVRLGDVFAPGPDLITASALFDLVSPVWIDRFVDGAHHAGAVIYAAINYNGHELWQPAHPADGAMLAAFHAHQKTDKGFGVSAGPDAAAHLVSRLQTAGYHVLCAESPWVLGSQHRDLIAAIADGSASAVAETGMLAGDVIENWRAARRTAEACVIGHTDILALPHGAQVLGAQAHRD